VADFPENPYKKALDFLSNFTNYEKKVITDRPPKIDLARMQKLTGLLGNPEQSFQSVHIAGTKGKGSCARIASALLSKSGYEPGLFTSPHLVDLRERIKTGGLPISEDDFGAAFIEARPACSKMVTDGEAPTFFEVLTALAFIHFRNKCVKAASVEVGLGGRLDSTNIVNPVVSIITSISLDHQKTLGNTIEEIAREKAGIIRKDIPVFTGRIPEAAFKEIELIAKEKGAPVYAVGRDIEVTGAPDRFSFESPFGGISDIEASRFMAPHQAENATLILSAFLWLRSNNIIKVASDEKLKEAIAEVYLPGRLDFVPGGGDPDGDGWPDMIIDSAHNVDSIGKAVAAIKERFPGRELVFAISINGDKDVRDMIAKIASVANTVICAKNNSDRAASPEDLKRAVKELSDVPVEVVNNATEAVELIESLKSLIPNRQSSIVNRQSPVPLFIFTGSTYWAGDVIKQLIEMERYRRDMV